VTEYGVAVDPLLEELEASLEGPAVVAIGGGHGQAQALAAVQGYAGTVTAVVGVTDNGGSSGRLAALGLPPPGDIRRCLVALSPKPTVWRDLFDHRFSAGDIAGHALGNLMLAGLADLHGDFEDGLRAAERLLETRGEVVPAARRALDLVAIVGGRRVSGQIQVTRARGAVDRLWLTPDDVPANPRALEAISLADQIVLGPGSLYSSLIAPLLLPGMAEAINVASARLVYVANLTTQDAETLGMDAAGHVAALVDMAGIRVPDAVLVNTAPVEAVAPAEPLRVDREELRRLGTEVMAVPLVARGGGPLHDPMELGTALTRLATA
jgi:uncharacterized cofD-like protein